MMLMLPFAVACSVKTGHLVADRLVSSRVR